MCTKETKLCDMTFQDLQAYLNQYNCYGLTASKRKRTIIYNFERYYNKIELSLKVMVLRSNKHVISVRCGDNVYTSFEELSKVVERK